MADRVEDQVRDQFGKHLAAITDPRYRAMVENLRDFIVFEFAGKQEELAALFTADAELHNYGFDPELHLKGRDAIAGFYGGLASVVTVSDWSLERLIVGDAGLAGLASQSALTTAEILRAANRSLPGNDSGAAGDARYNVTVKVAFFRRFEGELASEWVVVPGHGTIEQVPSDNHA